MNIYGIIGYKNAGKTSLVERLITEITGRGFSVSTVKHAHHAFDLDQPGKDTFRHRQAGARQVMLSTGARWVLMTELRGTEEPALADLLARMDKVDLILIEGYKRDRHPKIEVHRAVTRHPLIAPGDDTVRAVACDTLVAAGVPLLDLNDTGAVADFILGEVGLVHRPLADSTFDTFIMVDWSGGNDRGHTPKKDAIWAGVVRDGISEPPVYLRNRAVAEAWITRQLEVDRMAGRKVCIGFDFAFAYPAGFAEKLTQNNDPLALWDWFEARVQDAIKGNNRFDLAGQINAQFPGVGPFWFNGLQRDIADLPRKGNDRDFRWKPARRQTELAATGSFEAWQLAGSGAVGSQIIMGLPVLSRLRRRFAGQIAVWPFEPLGPPITLLEIWPSLIAKEIASAAHPAEIKDAAQVRILAAAIAALPPETLARMLTQAPSPEGWIFGVGHETELRQAAARIAATGAAQT